MQQSYRQLLLSASSDTDIISFGAYYEYQDSGVNAPQRKKNVGRLGVPSIDTMVNLPLSRRNSPLFFFPFCSFPAFTRGPEVSLRENFVI